MAISDSIYTKFTVYSRSGQLLPANPVAIRDSSYTNFTVYSGSKPLLQADLVAMV